MVQVETSVEWEMKEAREREERKKESGRKAERERERGCTSLLLWASNWNNGNWLSSNEYSIGLPTFEQGNERKILGGL